MLKSKLFSSIFGGVARDFYLQNTRSGMPLEELAKIMFEEYDSEASQPSAQYKLERITLSQVMEENNISDKEKGLNQLVDEINITTLEAPPPVRTDEHTRRLCRHAVPHQTWAHVPIGQNTTACFIFSRFVTSLKEQLQLKLETAMHPKAPPDPF